MSFRLAFAILSLSAPSQYPHPVNCVPDSLARLRRSVDEIKASEIVDAIEKLAVLDSGMRSLCPSLQGQEGKVALEVSRLLERPELRLGAARLLYRLGPNARPALPAITRAYIGQHRESETIRQRLPFHSGNAIVTEESLKCLRLSLATKRPRRPHCKYLDALDQWRPSP